MTPVKEKNEDLQLSIRLTGGKVEMDSLVLSTKTIVSCNDHWKMYRQILSIIKFHKYTTVICSTVTNYVLIDEQKILPSLYTIKKYTNFNV